MFFFVQVEAFGFPAPKTYFFCFYFYFGSFLGAPKKIFPRFFRKIVKNESEMLQNGAKMGRTCTPPKNAKIENLKNRPETHQNTSNCLKMMFICFFWTIGRFWKNKKKNRGTLNFDPWGHFRSPAMPRYTSKIHAEIHAENVIWL